MRFALFSLVIAILAAFVMAAAPHQAVIMSWPKETPDSVVAAARKYIEDAGGVITHDYNIIKGFACHAPASVFEFVSTMDATHKPEIENDGVVTTQQL